MTFHHLSRRTVLASAAAMSLSPLIGRNAYSEPSATVCEAVAPPRPISARAERAVSLRRLSADLEAGKPAALQGLTRLDGYITDQDNHDIVLWGLAESDQPELHVEDLIVALRAAHGRYGERRDGRSYFTTPLISIDPDPIVSGKLKKIRLGGPGADEAFGELCKSPQTVRIEGMPRDTRLAKLLVDADYRMKMVGQGTVKLPIASPFPSQHEVRIRKWRELVASGGKMPPYNTRFWFQAGSFNYQVTGNSDTVFVDTAQVVLNDEDQILKGGKLTASGNTDAITRAFVCAWTNRMEDIYRAEPIWRDMHNVFRHFAVARIIKDRDAFAQTDFASEFLLDRYVIPKVLLPATLPGLGHIVRDEKGTSWRAFFVCGGVAVGFGKPLNSSVATEATRSSGQSVVASRPGLTAVSWGVTPGVVPRSREPQPDGTPAVPRPTDSFQGLFKRDRPGIAGGIKPL